MRISDWSSDVCSSDLGDGIVHAPDAGPIAVACTLEHGGGGKRARRSIAQVVEADGAHRLRRHISVVTQSEAERTHLLRQRQLLCRSEESSVGKGCVRTVRSRGSTYN